MLPTLALTLTLLFLLGTFSVSMLTGAYRSLPKSEIQKLLSQPKNGFYYHSLHHYFFRKEEYEGVFFAAVATQRSTQFLYVFFLSLLLNESGIFIESGLVVSAAAIIALLFASFLIGDYIPRILGTSYPPSSFRFAAPLASTFMSLTIPLTYPYLKLTQALPTPLYFDHLHDPETYAKQEIIEIIHEASLTEQLDENEKKLISSLLSFCEHLAREVMVPRVDLFCLEASTPIRKAIVQLEAEGYSRVPIYEDTVDTIVGILLYKDLLSAFRIYLEKGQDPSILDAPVSTLQKPPLYTPETKKISDLLQEFRKKQVHMAIVVDEYGGTEGIVTIEDILEDIVGEIIDEYDVEEDLFKANPDGSWTVDPRMSILDAEEQLQIKIPEGGDFDTIGGYIFHCAGEIPSKGFTISSDAFDLEVLRSSDRSIEKVRISPREEINNINKSNDEKEPS